ncbi:tetratricopeptide repeat protein [Elizabethkingia meningoseptica]|uniref:tetratricopeptide repeat protein n=1 Tax=Elizabethkingia meningoseptica TaxID=238 RepID=UPI003891658C
METNTKIPITLITKFFALAIFCFLATTLCAQNKKAYDAVYYKIILRDRRIDFKKAFKEADSLYRGSEIPALKARSLLIKAILHQRSGDLNKAVEHALKAEEILNKTDDILVKANVYGFLATQYRILKLYSHSEKYLQRAFEVSKKIKDPDLANSIAGNLWQEIAYYEVEKKNYRKSIECVTKSQQFFKSAKRHEAFFAANNEQLLGLNYYYLQDFDTSLKYYRRAGEIAEKIPENCITGLIYNGFARIYLEKGNFRKAKKYIDTALKVSDRLKHLHLKNEIYETYNMYYTLLQDVDNMARIQKKRDSVAELLSRKSTIFINDFYQKMDHRNDILQYNNHIKNWIILIICMVLIGNVIFFTRYKRKFKKTVEKYNEELQTPDVKTFQVKGPYAGLPMLFVTEDKRIVNDEDDFSKMMTPETEERILFRLYDFENSILYTRKKISLSFLAAYCGTNTKYLSYIINNCKKKDFNNYINELRIKYIIGKLKNKPQYRKYKVATLAEEAGFSSPNKFAAVFKKEVDMTPSLYIKHLNNMDKSK